MIGATFCSSLEVGKKYTQTLVAPRFSVKLKRPGRCFNTTSGPNRNGSYEDHVMASKALPSFEGIRQLHPEIGRQLSCSVPECQEYARFRGWCRKHYNRWQRHGDPTAGRTPNGKPLDWLKAAISLPSDECIEWPFSISSDGYGRVRFEGKFRPATHASLSLFGVPQPTPHHKALHEPQVCHNRACINPLHLRWGFPAENTADRILDGTAALGAGNPAAKLTARQVERIRTDNRLHREIAADFGVSRSQVSRIKNGSAWS